MTRPRKPIDLVPGERRRGSFDVAPIEIVRSPAATCFCIVDDAEDCARLRSPQWDHANFPGARCFCPCHSEAE